MPTIVTISGTSRPGNYTAFALAVLNDALRERGKDVVSFDARELELAFPGQPPTDDAKRLTDAVKGAAAVVLATPEYHGSFCAMTKLIIENLGFPSALKGKPVALLGVAAGRIGAIKSLEHLRSVCAHVGSLVVPQAVSLAGIRGSFDEQGNCTDAATVASIHRLADGLLEFVHDYVCPRHALEEAVRTGTISWTAST